MNPEKPQKTTSAGITLPVLTFGAIGLVCLFIFMLVKGRMRDIFQPRRILKQGRPPWIPGIFGWIPIVYRTDEQFLVHTCGMSLMLIITFMIFFI